MQSKAIWLCCLMAAATLTALAQVTPTEPATLNLTLGEQRVKFAPTRSFQEMRLEVVNSVGETVFTHLTTEAEFDWNLRTGNGEVLAPGLYRYALTLKFGADQTRQHTGHFIVEKGQDQIWLTASDGAEVSGTSLNVARSGGRSLAGFRTSEDKSVKRDVSGREIVDEKGGNLNNLTKAVRQEKAALLGTLNRVAKFGAGGVADTDSGIREDASGRLGFNVNSSATTPYLFNGDIVNPGASLPALILQSEADHARLEMRSAGAVGTHAPIVQGRAASGTLSAPGATPINQIMGGFGGSGFDTTNGYAQFSSGFIGINAGENWTPTAHGSYITFGTTPNLSTTRTEKMRITGAGDVGIGTTAPDARLEVVNGASSTTLQLTNYGGSIGASIFGQAARGTQAAPLQTQAGDELLFIGAKGHTGTEFVTNSKAVMKFVATEAPTGAVGGTQIVFGTTTNATNTRVDRMTIDHDGQVGIGTTAPTALLSVNGTANKTGGGSWAVFSDERLKDIKGLYTVGWQALRKLQPIRFEYKADNALGLKNLGETIGFSAQSVAQVIPEAVSMTPQGYLQLNQDPILWTMLNAVKEQQAQIQQLLKNNRRLSQRVAQLERQGRKQ